jgi:hypothetical protein
MQAVRFLVLLSAAPALLACNCITRFSVCDEVRLTDMVFIGTVESVTNAKTIFEGAKTQEDLQAIVKGYVLQKNSATLRVKTVFRRPKDGPDDDDDKDTDRKDDKDDDKKNHTAKPKDPNDELKEGDAVVVYSDPGDCGFDFRAGETYLVYADEDEQDTHLETTACTRTARVSDAGEDLAYLYFYQNGDSNAGRLEGFATSVPHKLDQDRFQYTGRIDSPVPGIAIELQQKQQSFYTATDANGRFVFDGLAEGAYKLFAYPPDQSDHPKPLSSAVPLQIKPRSCNGAVLLIPGARTPTH